MRGTIEGDGALDVDEVGYAADDVARRRRRIEQGAIAALVVVVLAAIALLGFRSGADGKQDRDAERASAATATTAAPTTTQPATTTAPPADRTTTPPTTAAPAQDPAAPPAVIEDGRHPAYLTGLDATGRTLQFDVVQYLTGDDATEYVEAHPDEYPGMYEETEENGGYPYDVLVANDNPRLRTLPIAADAQIVVLQTDQSTYDSHTIGLADLPAYLAAYDQWVEVEGRLSNSVFWVTVHDGEIVALEEQFQA